MRYLLTIISLIGIHYAYADEYTIEAKAFHIETPLEAVFLPAQIEEVRITPEEWSDYTITSLVEHGARVKKGTLLIDLDSRDLDKQISSLEKSITTESLELSQTQLELQQLKITTPRSLATFQRNEQEAAENLEHYQKIQQPLEIDTAKRSVLSSEFYLASQQEELEQLLKMYSEDDKTEETEEMILKRARYYVERAEFSLKTARINSTRALSTEIPRKHKSKKRAAEKARIANTEAKQKLPRELQIKQQAASKATEALQDNKEKLTKLKTDKSIMSITSPIDGTVYYGEIKHGKWTSEAATKILRINSKLKAHTTLMSIIPANASLSLYSLASEDKLASVRKGAQGYANTKLNTHQRFPVEISNVNSHPSTKGHFLTTITASLPSGINIVPGMKAEVKIISQVIEEALQVPVDYLKDTTDGGHSVQIKLADGKSSTRKVIVGTSSDKWAVVTQGLEKGQVIIK
jgi:HlyD family secretion protein